MYYLMTKLMIACFIVVLICAGCGLNAREEALRKKEVELAAREQQLSLREKSLELEEEQVLQLKQKLDSAKTKTDTTLLYNQQLIGQWNVKMTCTETTCSGSAVGDVKTETWDISYQNSLIIANAIASDKLARIYTGSYDGTTLTLSADVASTPSDPATKMVIRLTMTAENTMEGQRIIDRENDCRIVYNLQLNKQ
jgi:hypothetical protein